MVEDIIQSVIAASSSEDLSSALKDCLHILNSKSSKKRVLIDNLNDQLLHKGGMHRLESIFVKTGELPQDVYVHRHDDSPLIYASHSLIAINKINDYKHRLQWLINFFDNELTEPKAKGLAKDEIFSVCKLMQKKYRLFDIITCKKDLEIFLFNNSHIE